MFEVVVVVYVILCKISHFWVTVSCHEGWNNVSKEEGVGGFLPDE